MQVQYLEIVTKEVGAVCAAYALTNGVQFGEPDPRLGNARNRRVDRWRTGGGTCTLA